MQPSLRIAVVGDFNPEYHTHHAINASLEHAAAALGLRTGVLGVRHRLPRGLGLLDVPPGGLTLFLGRHDGSSGLFLKSQQDLKVLLVRL